MDYLIEKMLFFEKLFGGRVIDLYLEEVEFLNGKMSIREVVKYFGVVVVIVLISDYKMVMVK